MSIYRQADGVLAEVLDGRAALVNPEGTELITLNAVGSLVWSLLDGNHDVDSLVTGVLEACDPVERASVDTDVRTFLTELASLALVVEVTQ